jgi:hypothetical protein
MARSRVSLRFIPDEYDSFVRAIPNDPRLPATYDECRKRCLEEDAKTVANGEIVKEVVIHYDHFVKYCRDTRAATELRTYPHPRRRQGFYSALARCNSLP